MWTEQLTLLLPKLRSADPRSKGESEERLFHGRFIVSCQTASVVWARMLEAPPAGDAKAALDEM